MPEGEVRVVPRNLRWEVRVGGVARPMLDWLCTKERAIEHAIERAREVDARVIVIEGPDFDDEDVIVVEPAPAIQVARPVRYGLVA